MQLELQVDIGWERAATESVVGQFWKPPFPWESSDMSAFSPLDGRQRVDNGPSMAVSTQARALNEPSGVH